MAKKPAKCIELQIQ